MPYIIYSCGACRTTIFGHEDDPDYREIHAGSDYCQACTVAINTAIPPAAELTPEELRQESLDAWYNENSKAAYDHHRQSIADANDKAETDPYFGRN